MSDYVRGIITFSLFLVILFSVKYLAQQRADQCAMDGYNATECQYMMGH